MTKRKPRSWDWLDTAVVVALCVGAVLIGLTLLGFENRCSP